MNIGARTYTEGDIRRFYSHVAVGKPTECWEWLGCTNNGYGWFSLGDVWQLSAPRFAFWIATGHHPGDLLVCHSCDNPSCVNPKHLWLGTYGDNMQDASKKGRLGKFGNIKLERTRLELLEEYV